MYLSGDEVEEAKNWLKEQNIDKYVMLETNYTSSQSYWERQETDIALKILNEAGYTILLTHRKDGQLDNYRRKADVYLMDVHYRHMPAFYNLSSGFIGVSSGISCIVHTHQCRKDIPHLEFVRGEHWCTRGYHKEKKQICFNRAEVEKIIRATFL
jgi:hypothetical protein